MGHEVQQDVAVEEPARFIIEGAETEGSVVLSRFSPGRRRRNAVKVAALILFAGIALIFVPIVHFICPLFLLAAPAAAVWQHSIRGRISGGSGRCPGCGEAVPVSSGRKLDPRFYEFCPHCKRMIEVSIPRLIDSPAH